LETRHPRFRISGQAGANAMNDIASIRNTGPSGIAPIARPTQPADAGAAGDSITRTGSDRAEFSQVAQYLSKLADLPVRQDLVDRVRSQLDAGTYNADAKLDGALNDLADALTPLDPTKL